MVFHRAAVHHHDAVACVDFRMGSNLSVFKGYHDRGCLECGTRFQHIADGVITHFVIVAVARFHHVDNGFYFSGLYFHQYGNAHTGVYLFQLVYQCFFANILHAHVDGGNDVAAVYGSNVHYVQVFVHHLLAMGDTVTSFQQRIKGKFDTVFGSLRCIGIEVAECTCRQRTERFLTLVERLFMEASFIFV